MGPLRDSPSLNVGKVEDWDYRGEGAANVVVSYRGASSELEGKVLRIPKAVISKEKATSHRTQFAVLNTKHFDLNAESGAADEDQYADISTSTCPPCDSVPHSTAGKASPLGKGGELGGRAVLQETVPQKEGSLLSPLEQEIWAKYPTLVSVDSAAVLAHEYYKLVMGPLLGEGLVDPGVTIPMNTAFLDKLRDAVESSRPARWQKEGPLQLLSGWALLIADHTSFSGRGLARPEDNLTGPSVCVEVKPKAGSLPTSGCIKPDNRVKLEKSRYELMQHWKSQRGKVKAISSYDPLDLFSSDPTRVRRAIDSLFENPQNNLRVFISGEAHIWESSKEEGSIDKLERALERFCEPVNGSRLNVLKELLVQRLAGPTILKRLQSTQMLDRYDIEGVIHLYEYLCGHPPDEAVFKDLPTATRELLDLPRDSQLDIIRDFLVATTAKDCGLMLTFVAENGGEDAAFAPSESYTTIRTVRGQSFLCKAAYLDLDLKPVRKLPGYWNLDQEIVVAYRQAKPAT